MLYYVLGDWLKFNAIVRGDKKAPIKTGRIVSVELFDLIGKEVEVTVEERRVVSKVVG
jgi:hypothetical protein